MAVSLPHRTPDAHTSPRIGPAADVLRPPGRDEVSIYLCSKISANPVCHRQDATEAQRDAVAEALRKTPQARTVEAITGAEAYAQARKQLGAKILNAVRPGDLTAEDAGGDVGKRSDLLRSARGR